MLIRDLFSANGPLFSFEFFPPKTEPGERALLRTIEQLRPLNPSYISVTYGAGGSTRHKTVELVARIKRDYGVEAMAHLTCVGHSRDEITAILDRLHTEGIENVLPLRGDPPQGQSEFLRPANGFGYAAELVRFIREGNYPFCLGGAGYPEGHVESADRQRDLEHLRQKVAAGLDFVVTQLFFNSTDYFDFVTRAHAAGIGVPIIAGIMPITNFAQIQRFTQMCGAKIPPALQARLGAVQDNEDAVRAIGIEHATDQCRQLLAGGAPGIHFYTLNQSPATAAILAELRR